MLKKLLKKDLIATSRFFLPLLCGYAVLAVLGKVLFEIILNQSQSYSNSGFFNGMMFFSMFYVMIFVVYLVACYLMTSVFVVYDFYKTMVSDHGYLSHTLPVKTSTLIWSKTLISAFWHILVNMIVALSAILLFTGHFRQFPIKHIFDYYMKVIDSEFAHYTFYTVLNGIINLFNGPLMFFACIAIGQLWKNHRVMGAILTYIGMYVFMQILSTIVLIVTGNGSISHHSAGFFYNGYMIYATLFSLITTVVFFWITNYVLSRKLNLE